MGLGWDRNLCQQVNYPHLLGNRLLPDDTEDYMNIIIQQINGEKNHTVKGMVDDYDRNKPVKVSFLFRFLSTCQRLEFYLGRGNLVEKNAFIKLAVGKFVVHFLHW